MTDRPEIYLLSLLLQGDTNCAEIYADGHLQNTTMSAEDREFMWKTLKMWNLCTHKFSYATLNEWMNTHHPQIQAVPLELIKSHRDGLNIVYKYLRGIK